MCVANLLEIDLVVSSPALHTARHIFLNINFLELRGSQTGNFLLKLNFEFLTTTLLSLYYNMPYYLSIVSKTLDYERIFSNLYLLASLIVIEKVAVAFSEIIFV